MSAPTKEIIRLNDNTINQIAAGEVIERPSGVVRELVENAIDAGATEINIKINYDNFAITIKDNGCGIAPEQIPLAFERHSTSKIKAPQDLSSIHTLGFRGEALASIASIGKVTIKTATNDANGNETQLWGGEIVSSKSIAWHRGTQITVNDLFYNAPVRKKFFNTHIAVDDNNHIPLVVKTGERRAIKEEIINQILSSNNIHFRYTSILPNKGNLKTTEEINIPSSFDLKNKILHFYRTRDHQYPLEKTIIPVNEKVDHFEISGYITNLHCREKSNQKQFLIIKHRVLRDPYFIKSIQSAYLYKIPQGTHPICFIEITLPPDEVDINTHPRKEQIKFRDPSAFFKALSIAIKNTLSAHHFNSPSNNPHLSENQPTTAILSLNQPPNQTHQSEPSLNSPPSQINFNRPFDISQDEKQALRQHYFNTQIKEPPTFKILGQVAKCYILFSIENDLFITDQHAAHERINFDKINAHLKDKTDQQILLIPLLFEKTTSELEHILEQQSQLASLGFDLERFGDATIRINKVPAYLTEKKIKLITEDMLELSAQQQMTDNSEFIGQLTARMACRMSIMAGDHLNETEMHELIAEIYEKNYIYTCPHGRPFVKKIDEKELKHFFDRGRHII